MQYIDMIIYYILISGIFNTSEYPRSIPKVPLKYPRLFASNDSKRLIGQYIGAKKSQLRRGTHLMLPILLGRQFAGQEIF